MEILSTFHAQVECISVKNMPFKPMGMTTTTKTSPSLWGT